MGLALHAVVQRKKEKNGGAALATPFHREMETSMRSGVKAPRPSFAEEMPLPRHPLMCLGWGVGVWRCPLPPTYLEWVAFRNPFMHKGRGRAGDAHPHT